MSALQWEGRLWLDVFGAVCLCISQFGIFPPHTDSNAWARCPDNSERGLINVIPPSCFEIVFGSYECRMTFNSDVRLSLAPSVFSYYQVTYFVLLAHCTSNQKGTDGGELFDRSSSIEARKLKRLFRVALRMTDNVYPRYIMVLGRVFRWDHYHFCAVRRAA
jgi:hypothetical protein